MSFESHITIAKEHYDRAEILAQLRHWKMSKIDGDPVLGQQAYAYLTKHSHSFYDLYSDMLATKEILETLISPIPVIRCKIEAILFDQRYVK